MTDKELAFEPAHKLLHLIADRQISPVELTRLYLDRIERLDSQLNSFVTVTRDEALAAAKVAEDAVSRGDKLGPLHGLPIAIKDTQMTRGIRTTLGSVAYKDHIPEHDATVVQRVKSTGAIILGKTNAPELGIVGTCENRLGEPGRNPWNTDCTRRWIHRRWGSRVGRQPVSSRDRQRRRRVHSHTCPLLRHLWHQTDPG